jgi:starch phosphorylase
MTQTPHVAYFSMEIGLEPAIPTYAGGLGILAGDMLRAAADMELPVVGVTLLYRRGYFRQRIDASGWQTEEPVEWKVEDLLEPVDARVKLTLEGRPISIRAWRYRITGVSGGLVPVLLLDTDLPENAPEDRHFTDWLYGGDARYRLCQEAILGMGGVAMLEVLGLGAVDYFHLNEGHAALAASALVERELERHGGSRTRRAVRTALAHVRPRCVFTTHTPVPAGHDRFPAALVQRVVGSDVSKLLAALGQESDVNMSKLAATAASFVNAVSPQHARVTKTMFPGHEIESIPNGVHAATWAAPSLQVLFDRRLPGWRRYPLRLRDAVELPRREVWAAHMRAKRELDRYMNRQTGAGLVEDRLTLGFARRATSYKRLTLIFDDLDRLRSINRNIGAIQLVFAGKAHPHDHGGKEMIQRVHQAREALAGEIPVAYLPDYDMASAKLLFAGCDVWLNTPLPPLEASGTSGMKAALNGVPSLSVLDGWWIQGHIEGATGWAIGERSDARISSSRRKNVLHLDALYQKLGESVLPCFFHDRERFIDIMRQAIALNGSYFNAHRMAAQYLHHAYRGAAEAISGGPT